MQWWLIPFLAFALPAQALTLVTENYPPNNFSTDDGKTITGQATDVLREAIARAGMSATIALHPWRNAYKIAQETPDTCVYTTVRTEEREKQFKWVGPLVSAHWTLYALADSPIKANSLNELKRYVIGGYQRDAKSIHMQSLGFTVDDANTEQQSLKKLMSGRVDLWVSSTNSAPWNARALGIKLKPVYTLKEVFGYAACNLAVPDADIKRLNDALQRMRADGTHDRLLAPYR